MGDSHWQNAEFENIKKLVNGEYEFENVDTSDWQVYQNKEMGFEIKIPKDWSCDKVVSPSDTLRLVGCMNKGDEKYRGAYFSGKYDGKVNFDVLTFAKNIRRNDLTVLDYANEISKKEKLYTGYVVNIDGEPGLISDSGKEDMSHTFLIKDNFEWNIDELFQHNQSDKDIFEGAVNSFKFLDF